MRNADSSGGIRVELVDPTSAPLVLRLALEAFEEYRDSLVPPPGILRESLADVVRSIERGGAVVAWAGGVPVGAARFHAEPDHLYVGRVSVPPAYRRRGIATAMMRFLEEHGRGLSLLEIRVEVREALPGNIALYESLGFVRVGVKPHPREPAAMTITLAKPLRAQISG